LWMAGSSLKSDAELFTTIGRLLPKKISLANYDFVWRHTPYVTYLLNSLKVACVTTVLCSLVAIPAGYALARFSFKGATAYGVFLIMMQMFPAVLLVIPLFIILQRVHLINSHASVILTYMTVALPFCVWMLRSFFETIPAELEQAAIVDGCTRLGAMIRVVLPISGPGVATVAVYTFLLAWNEFLFALVFLQRKQLYTLSLGIAYLMDEQGVQWGWLMASATLTAVPVFLLFLLMQRFVVKGLVMGATKG